MKPPICKKVEKRLSIHGHTRVDPYYWLNDREDEHVIQYLNDENEYTNYKLKNVEELKDTLFEEMKGRIKQNDESVPYFKNGYFYQTRYEEGKEYPIYVRRKGSMDAEEEILLDGNKLSEQHSYYHIGDYEISPDNKLLAYTEDTVSRRIYTVKFINLETGEYLNDVIPNVSPNVEWANDNKVLFYTTKDEALRPYKVFRHELGTGVDKDVMIFHEKDETFRVGVGKSKTNKYIFIGSFQSISTEFRFIPADAPTSEPILFQERARGLEYSIAHLKDEFYILTNLNAKNFQLMKCSENATNKSNWETVIAHRSDVLLEDIDLFNDYLVLSERFEGITRINIINQKTGNWHYVPFAEASCLAYTTTNLSFDTDILRLGYQSMITPPSVFDYNMVTQSFTLLKEQEVKGFDKNNYTSERLYANSRDGKRIPVSLVLPKGYKKDGSEPLLLYAYGSYGYSMEPYFSAVRLSLLDRGFAFAIAHIRGGEEMGREWYDTGKMLYKKNTFNDFIDSAEFLISKQYTSKEHLYAMGGSAGGLLMGAVINMRPDLWQGVVAAVPFVDVVTTMLDDSIPLTTGEYDEWGNPNEKKYYEYILSYSPYDNVEAKDYPNLLVTTGLHDSQVQYWEPAKWVAKLRELKTDDNLLLLKTEMEAGHGGASGRFERLKEVALEYAFIIGLNDGSLE